MFNNQVEISDPVDFSDPEAALHIELKGIVS
jgi:hypothetical protein